MPRLHPCRGAVTGLLVTLATAPSAAYETHFEPIWLDPPAAVGRGDVPAVLAVPVGWQPGDAAVILLLGQPRHDAGRDRLMAALLDDGAAVLELDSTVRRGAAEPGSLGSRDEHTRKDLREAVRGLAEQSAPGLVVAIGWGEGGEAALGAAVAAEDGLAAGVAFDAMPPRFAVGAPVAAHEGWGRRSHRLCDLLAEATEPDAETPRAIAARCVMALEPRQVARVGSR